jgi:hypothetical protein
LDAGDYGEFTILGERRGEEGRGRGEKGKGKGKMRDANEL